MPNFVIDTLGGVQLMTGGGQIFAMAVPTAGSSDCYLNLYDGTSTSAPLVASVYMGRTGPVAGPNRSFSKGLYASMVGTTAGVAAVVCSGTPALTS